jgi:hypothetical protein
MDVEVEHSAHRSELSPERAWHSGEIATSGNFARSLKTGNRTFVIDGSLTDTANHSIAGRESEKGSHIGALDLIKKW